MRGRDEMTDGNPRERLVELLEAPDEASASVELARRAVSALKVVVDGLGAVQLPVTDADARRLKELARPARYGLGEQTLTDRTVRDTWEVPRELVHVEWAPPGLATDLEVVRDELGLPRGSQLTAELHSMLVYERGQFFVTHQDSEKDDGMVATLVVTLPSQHTGGELVVHHLGEATAYRGLDDRVALVAFYADCRHEVRRVRSGHRVTLTFNLLLDGDSAQPPSERVLIGNAAQLLREHVTTPVPRVHAKPAAPPRRLVVLLDHQYTERGLSASLLKGADVRRVALLREAAGVAGFESALALTDVHEVRDDTPGYRGGRGRREAGVEDADLLANDTVLTWWADDVTDAGPVTSQVDDDEVCAPTPSSRKKAYAVEREGYMGNYGNTVERWYRRAALVLWPADLGFATRAEAAPQWGLQELVRLATADGPEVAAQAARTLMPLWQQAVTRAGEQGELLAGALVAASAVDDAEVAAALLAPFAIETLEPAHAAALAHTSDRYGAQWVDERVRHWFSDQYGRRSRGRVSRETWAATLPEVCVALAGQSLGGVAAARAMLDSSWAWLTASAARGRARATTTFGQRVLADLGPPLAALVNAATRVEAGDLLDRVVAACREYGDAGAPWVMAALRAEGRAAAGGDDAPAWAQLTADQQERLAARLALPERRPDDWSMTLPSGCDCELCSTLAAFVADPAQVTLRWPLRQDRRTHVEQRITAAELPVARETRRVGSPHTLVLTKTHELFERDRRQRAQDAADLKWLKSR